MHEANFGRIFELFTGHAPYTWQIRTYRDMISGVFQDLSLPTGTGKTSVMAIWLLALSTKAAKGELAGFPRRLVWVVDRRTVVDQATHVAERLRERLIPPVEKPELQALRETLLKVSATGSSRLGEPITISTLRGECADNGEWRIDPSRPSILVGTVDMIGSKLLFSGYGDGKWHRPVHAGLLGEDTLLVLDEAHLSQPFSRLVTGITRLNSVGVGSLKPLQFVRLSATLGDGNSESSRGMVTNLGDNDEHLKRVLSAEKKLSLRESNNVKKSLVEEALKYKELRKKVVVFTEKPYDVLDIRSKIAKQLGGNMVVALTGTMRGYERDALFENHAFKQFLTKDETNETVILVTNSAGEVGIDLYADHMVSDLVPAERMIQRFGRVNRAGKASATIAVYKRNKLGKSQEPLEQILESAWKYLDKIKEDASPLNILNNPPPKEACTPIEKSLPLDRWYIDNWSMTSVSGWHGRLDVHGWLKGVSDEPPDVYFAWRSEVEDLSRLSDGEIGEIIESFPILSRERLRETVGTAISKIKLLARTNPNRQAILISYDNRILWKGSLSDLAEGIDQRENRIDIAYSTLLLPTVCGGLKDGFFSPDDSTQVSDSGDAVEREGGETENDQFSLSNRGSKRGEESVTDVSEDSERIHGKLIESNDGATILSYNKGEAEYGAKSREDAIEHIKSKFKGGKLLLWQLPSQNPDYEDPDEPTESLFYLILTDYDPENRSLSTNISLQEHLTQTAEWARKISTKLGLPENLTMAIAAAAERHDVGKKRRIWQEYAFNSNLSNALAKSRRYRKWSFLKGYRHELGSVFDLEPPDGIINPGESEQVDLDLIKHLIVSHHGYARPTLPEKVNDPEKSAETVRDEVVGVANRFIYLQRRYGWWGLAYLESIVKAADVLASKQVEMGA